MKSLWDNFMGLMALARLGMLTGFRFNGKYWKWRMHTAFGRGMPPKAEYRRGVREYGRWVHRMRRL